MERQLVVLYQDMGRYGKGCVFGIWLVMDSSLWLLRLYEHFTTTRELEQRSRSAQYPNLFYGRAIEL